MQENDQTAILVSINTPSRSGTPSLLSLKKPIVDCYSPYKDQENTRIFSNENNDTFNQAPDVNKFKADWKAVNNQSSESEDIVAFEPDERVPMKNLSSEDTFQTHLEMSKSCFSINYDDSYSGPPSLSQEEINLGLCAKEVVIDLVSDESSSFFLQGTSMSSTSKIDTISLLNSQKTEEQVASSPAPASIELINYISPVRSEQDGEDSQSEEEMQRLQREKEERETQELIWQLMRQEQMELYEMQVQYMQTQVEGISEEDLRALQAAMQENNQVVQTISSYASSNTQGSEENEEEEEGDEEEEAEEEEWDYERLLALGQALGDVKTERWRARSKQIIDALPSLCYQEIKLRAQSHSCLADSKVVKKQRMSESHTTSPTLSSPLKTGTLYEDYRCVVCMEDFEGSDEVKILPCTHYFHIACTTGWLTDHNSCPTCKKKVVATPEK